MDKIEPIQEEVHEEAPQNPESLLSSESPMFASIQGFFGIDRADGDQRVKLNEIYEALRDENNTESAMLWKIRSLESRIGVPPIGQDRLSYLHQYITMQKHIGTLQKQLEQIYG